MNHSKRTRSDYSIEFKLRVVSEVERGEITYKNAQDKYGIQGRSTVLSWLRKYGELNWDKGEKFKGLPRADSLKENCPLLKKIEILEQELAYEKSKNIMLTDMMKDELF